MKSETYVTDRIHKKGVKGISYFNEDNRLDDIHIQTQFYMHMK